MRFLLANILTFFMVAHATADAFEDKYGIGILEVGCTIKDDFLKGTYTIRLYNEMTDTAGPAKTYRFDYGDSLYYKIQMELNNKRIWFDGEFVMLCLAKKGSWYKVRIRDDKEYWVQQSTFKSYSNMSLPGLIGLPLTLKNYEFHSWKDVVSQMEWVSRTDTATNPIRNKPNEHAPKLRSDTRDHLTAKRVSGRWLKVTTQLGEGYYDEDLEVYREKYFKHGWLKWRDDRDFLIQVMY
ncbi:MAG: hypothetical protein V4590_13935 [Bacteroidota bacterium]